MQECLVPYAQDYIDQLLAAGRGYENEPKGPPSKACTTSLRDRHPMKAKHSHQDTGSKI